MDRPETWRCRENNNIGKGDGFLVGVESDKLVFLGDFDFFFVLLLDFVVASIQPVFESVRHGNQLNASFCRERLRRGARTTATATNKGELDGVASSRMSGTFDRKTTQQGRARGDRGG